MTAKAKVGIIVDDFIVTKQIKDLIDLSRTSDFYEIDCLIIQNAKTGAKKSFVDKVKSQIKTKGMKRFAEDAGFQIITKFEKILLKRSKTFKDFYQKFDLRDMDIDHLIVNPNISKSGFVYRYTDDDITAIRGKNLQALIRGGSGILRGDILTVCPKGILSFHHADNDVNRGSPPAFWEVFLRQRSTGFIIQILGEELDGGDVIYKGKITTSFMYLRNLARLFTKSNIFMHRILEKMFRDDTPLKIYPKKPYDYPLYRTPSLWVQFQYCVKTLWYMVLMRVRHVCGRAYRWGVAYQFCDDWRDVTLWKSKIIPNPPNHFLADPFVIERDGKHYCYVEDYDYTTKKGSIAAYEITKDGHKDLGVVLEENFHLSYPFLVEHDGELYMCPETHEAKEIRLYKCVEFPMKWELEKVLMGDFTAADTTLFYKDKKWWMLTNICSAGLKDVGSELHIFSSDMLLSDNWKPHDNNPVIFDSECARNGGLLYDGDRIFRVHQTYGWDFYGESFGVHEITKISQDDYQETPEFTVQQNFIKGAKGTHTYNYHKGLVVTDFVKMENYKHDTKI